MPRRMLLHLFKSIYLPCKNRLKTYGFGFRRQILQTLFIDCTHLKGTTPRTTSVHEYGKKMVLRIQIRA